MWLYKCSCLIASSILQLEVVNAVAFNCKRFASPVEADHRPELEDEDEKAGGEEEDEEEDKQAEEEEEDA